MSHCLDSALNNKRSKLSLNRVEESMNLIFDNYRNLDSLKSLENLQHASYLAGLAINETKLQFCTLSHTLSLTIMKFLMGWL